MKIKETSGYVVMCTSCGGLAKEPKATKGEAKKLATIHVSLDSGHKSHKGHIVAIIPCELISS